MFSLLNGVYESYLTPPKVNLLIVGAQGAGKTTFLERVKVTEFSNRVSPSTTQMASSPLPNGMLPGSQEKPQVLDRVVTSSSIQEPKPVRRNWLCPAPAKYQHAVDDDESDEEVAAQPPSLPDPAPVTHKSSTKESMESIDLTSKSPPTTQYNLKPKCKMLPLDRIRPTIGMNLAKLPICKAKVHAMDLGGRLIDLWDRYYQDADAVIFVWRMGEDTFVPKEDDDDERPKITPEYQMELLEKVRKSIPDDVPFLIVGHLFEDAPQFHTNKLYSTSLLLPWYHNPLQALYFVDSKSGNGVKTAMEWLIPVAKRQLKVREKREIDKL